MAIDDATDTPIHAGRLIARRLRASGIDTMFTLSGGHLFSIYDGCRSEGIRLIDTRHEQTAAFAAEGWSKVTRVPGVAAPWNAAGGRGNSRSRDLNRYSNKAMPMKR